MPAVSRPAATGRTTGGGARPLRWRVSTAPTATVRGGHVPGLDGARALATLSVFFFHALWRTPALAPLRPVLGHADIGVEVFFILSGLPRGAAAGRPRGARRPTGAFARLLAQARRSHLARLPGGAAWGRWSSASAPSRAGPAGSSTGSSSTAGSTTAAAPASASPGPSSWRWPSTSCVLPLAAVLLLAGRRRLDAWIARVPRRCSPTGPGRWPSPPSSHTEPWVRVLPAVPARLRGRDAARRRRGRRRARAPGSAGWSAASAG